MDCYSNVQSVSREGDHILILEDLPGIISAIQNEIWHARAYQTVVLVYIHTQLCTQVKTITRYNCNLVTHIA